MSHPLKRPTPLNPFRFTPLEWGLPVLALVYCAAGYGLAVHYGVEDRFSLTLYSKTFMLFSLFTGLAYIVWRLLTIMISRRPRRLIRLLVRDARWNWLAPARLIRAVPVILTYLIFVGAFTSLKTMIPVVHPYDLDPLLARWDRALHFGVDPWRIYQHVLGFPVVTFIVNFIYNFWFAVMIAMLYWQAFSMKDDRLRLRFFYCFFLVWGLIGTAMAMILSSVGPCYYERLTGDPGPYAGQMTYLRAVNDIFPVWALKAQDLLWAGYEQGGLSAGGGISAMPSLHVASSVLFALTGWASSRRAGIVLTAFLAVIVAGSVHLAWHYALDGYVAAILAGALWYAVGRFIPKR